MVVRLLSLPEERMKPLISHALGPPKVLILKGKVAQLSTFNRVIVTRIN